MKKGTVLFELLVFYGLLGLVMVGVMFGFRTVLFNLNLQNEAYVLKQYLDYAQDFASANQTRITWQNTDASHYQLLTTSGKTLQKHEMPKKILVNGPVVTFTPNLTPSKGATLTLSLEKKTKKVIIDPTTGRIRIL